MASVSDAGMPSKLTDMTSDDDGEKGYPTHLEGSCR